MILESLVGLAEREGLVDNPDYETKEIHWRITISAAGRFVSLESLLSEEPAEGKTGRGRPRGLPALLPRPFPGARPAGVHPDAGFLVGNASFVCGLDITEKQTYAKRSGELGRRRGDFTRLVKEAADDTTDEGLRAVTRLFASEDELRRVEKEVQTRAAAKELGTNHLLSFGMVGDATMFVHLRPAVMVYWGRKRASLAAAEHTGQCLVTGAVGPVVDKHPPIKGVPGGTPSGVAIVTFNLSAFESYGFRRNENAPVSRRAAEAYTAALNRLLNPQLPDPKNPNVRLPQQRVKLSQDTVALFWTDEPSPVPAAIVPAIAEGDPEAAEELGVVWEVDESYRAFAGELEAVRDATPLRDAHDAPWKGTKPQELEDAGAFRLLILSGGQGRATVRAFRTTQVKETVKAVRRWFEDIRLSTLRNKRALRPLLRSLAVRGNEEKLPPTLAGDVFLAILTGRALPQSVLEMAVRRCRSEANSEERNGRLVRNLKVPYERAALIKAYLNRARQSLHTTQGIHFEELRPAMNEHERNKGYLLGRMFACIEWMQELALGDVGATVTDRYFSAACATPQAVFPRLLKTEVHHYRKAREGQRGGSARWLHGQISQLATWLIGQQNAMQDGEALDAFLRRSAGRPLAGFPAFLPLPEQGLFTLGYHQQRAERFRKREHAAAPAAVAEAN